MRKTHYRDYATEAFRFLAREGSTHMFTQRVYNEALERQKNFETIKGGICAPTEAAVMRAEQEVIQAAASIRDLEAAEFALFAVERMRCRAAADAVRMIYMADAASEIERGEIGHRIKRATVSLPAGEATIYRWLALARDLFAEKRGLRM